jgi:hypothetical protein
MPAIAGTVREPVDNLHASAYHAASIWTGAQVAELVDAQVSGTCGRKAVEVRVFSWAPNLLYFKHLREKWVNFVPPENKGLDTILTHLLRGAADRV